MNELYIKKLKKHKRGWIIRSPEASKYILKNMHCHSVIFVLTMDLLKSFDLTVFILSKNFQKISDPEQFFKKHIKKSSKFSFNSVWIVEYSYIPKMALKQYYYNKHE